jgi:hypothetical protein
MARRFLSRRQALQAGLATAGAGALAAGAAGDASAAASAPQQLGTVVSTTGTSATVDVAGSVATVALEGFPKNFTLAAGDEVMVGRSLVTGQRVVAPLVAIVHSTGAALRSTSQHRGYRLDPGTTSPDGKPADAEPVLAFVVKNRTTSLPARAVAVLRRSS